MISSAADDALADDSVAADDVDPPFATYVLYSSSVIKLLLSVSAAAIYFKLLVSTDEDCAEAAVTVVAAELVA